MSLGRRSRSPSGWGRRSTPSTSVGLVHRDIKSSNILLADADGAAMLSDFGVAKGAGYTVLTRTGLMVGTLDYLAPELIRGDPATPASDVYAFACLVYECLAGAPPFSSPVDVRDRLRAPERCARGLAR